jgi:hypothetical protein
VACNNGRIRLKDDEDRQLFSESAGTCLLCCTALFAKTTGRSVPIAERAHIIAHSDDGPRPDTKVATAARDAPGNIVLLCPTCHTKADKAPEEYPAETLLRLKERRRHAVALLGGAPEYSSRQDAQTAVASLLAQARVAFETYGPSPDDGGLPTVEAAARWSEAVLETIVPAHELVVAIVENNHDLAQRRDVEAAERLRLHAVDLRNKHAGLPLIGPAMRFPVEANALFAEEEK